MRRTAKLAILGASVAAVAAAAIAPAMASVNVQLTTSSGTRTLNLYQPDGTTPLTSSDLSSGASNFLAQVTDSTYSNKGFNVQATMSNLYQWSASNPANGGYTCSSMVPSSAISLSSPASLFTLGGVSANLTPVFQLSGILDSSVIPLLGLNTVNFGTLSPPATVNGLLPSTPLTQSQLTGSNVTNLFGSTLNGVLNKLPLNLASNTIGGSFASPDVHPTCDLAAAGATPVQIMDWAADPAGVLADVKSLITGVTGAAPSLTTLINDGYLTSAQVSTALQGVPSLVSDLGVLGITNNLTTIENTLTASISNVTTLANSLVQSGSYTSSPTLSVNTSGIPAGTYKGVMTVTLLDQ
ncbi:MAG TPA: hypothetical protein VFZ97_17630 [Acidimicrobiales bacterium]